MEEFRECPTCGYTRGFHVSFRREDERFRVIFICPECGSSFDIDIFEDRIKKLQPKRGKDY
jgi:ssDNA-binding Zn-finger/Zn-ribbon topoisomerase 1